MSDLPELLEAVAALMTDKCNALILSSGGDLFGIGDLRPLAAELIDYTLNREFGTGAAFDGSQASSGGAMASEVPATCLICGEEEGDVLSLCDGICDQCSSPGQCSSCPYKLGGVFARTGCPNCPERGGGIR